MDDAANALSGAVPLRLVLTNLSAELVRLSALTREIEAAIFDTAQSSPSPAMPLSPRLHYLDFIVQSLDELAATIERLSHVIPAAAAIDADQIMGPLKLDFLRQSLLRVGEVTGTDRQMSRPEIELF